MALEPIAGICVLDFTAFPPGGACTDMRADLEAEVTTTSAPPGVGYDTSEGAVVGGFLGRGGRGLGRPVGLSDRGHASAG